MDEVEEDDPDAERGQEEEPVIRGRSGVFGPIDHDRQSDDRRDRRHANRRDPSACLRNQPPRQEKREQTADQQ